MWQQLTIYMIFHKSTLAISCVMYGVEIYNLPFCLIILVENGNDFKNNEVK